MNLPPCPYAEPLKRYFHYIWDTKDIPQVQEVEGFAVFTPQFDNLHIYGRGVRLTHPEDARADRDLDRAGRFMGQWFSVVCPDGELGSMAWFDVEPITEAEFSAAYERGWKPV